VKSVDHTNILSTLDLIYSSARTQIMGSSAVSSLIMTFHFLKNVVPALSPDTTTTTLDQSALATQRRDHGTRWLYQWMIWFSRRTRRHTRRCSRRTKRWLCGLLLLLQRAGSYEVSVSPPEGKTSERSTYGLFR